MKKEEIDPELRAAIAEVFNEDGSVKTRILESDPELRAAVAALPPLFNEDGSVNDPDSCSLSEAIVEHLVRKGKLVWFGDRCFRADDEFILAMQDIKKALEQNPGTDDDPEARAKLCGSAEWRRGYQRLEKLARKG